MSFQVLLNGTAQSAGALSVNQPDLALAGKHCMIDVLIGFHQCLFHRQPAQICLHRCGALNPVQRGVAALALCRRPFRRGRGLFHLIGGAQTFQRNLRFDDAGPHLHHSVSVRQIDHGGRLIQLGNDHFLPDPNLLQRHILLFNGMHHIRLIQQLFRILLCNLTGTDGALCRAGFLVLLQLAQLIGQRIGFRLHLLCHLLRLFAGRLQFVFALPDQFFPFFLGALQLMRCLILQPVDLILAFLQLKLQIVQLSQHCIQTLILRRQMLLRRLNDPLRDAQLFTDEEGVGLTRHANTQLVCGSESL